MSLPDEYADLPLFTVLDLNAVQQPNLLPAQSNKSAQEQEEQESASTLSNTEPRCSKRTRHSKVSVSSDSVDGSHSTASHDSTSKVQAAK